MVRIGLPVNGKISALFGAYFKLDFRGEICDFVFFGDFGAKSEILRGAYFFQSRLFCEGGFRAAAYFMHAFKSRTDTLRAPTCARILFFAEHFRKSCAYVASPITPHTLLLACVCLKKGYECVRGHANHKHACFMPAPYA